MRLEACGVCHTDMYTASGADPVRLRAHRARSRGRGHRRAARPRRVARPRGRPRGHAVLPQCGECEHCISPRTNLCTAIRAEQNLGHLPDGTTRLSRDGEDIRHFMGTSTFAEYTVMPEIALAVVSPDAPADRACVFACGLSTGLGAAINTAGVEPGSTVRGLRRRPGRARRRGRRPAAGRRADRVRGPVRGAARDGRAARERPTRSSAASDSVERILEMTGGMGADYTFEATGNVKVMRQAVESARMGWGLCTVAGVAGKGETLDVVPRLLITGRRVAGSSFGGVKGRDQVPVFVERYLDGRDRRGPADLAQAHPRRGQQGLRADARPGRHPQRDRLRLMLAATRWGPDDAPGWWPCTGSRPTGAFWSAVARELGAGVRADRRPTCADAATPPRSASPTAWPGTWTTSWRCWTPPGWSGAVRGRAFDGRLRGRAAGRRAPRPRESRSCWWTAALPLPVPAGRTPTRVIAPHAGPVDRASVQDRSPTAPPTAPSGASTRPSRATTWRDEDLVA